MARTLNKQRAENAREAAIAAIPGKTITYLDFFSPHANMTQRLVDYYEGHQTDYVIQMLDGAYNGWGKRKEWKHRGIVPRARNITRSIVEKSGMLFNRPPVLGIVTQDDSAPITDEVYQEMLENADYLQDLQNIDVFTRLCGSIVVLQQMSVPDGVTTQMGQYRYDYTRGDQLLFKILHHGNTVVRMNESNTRITELGYLIEDSNLSVRGGARPKQWKYCVWTPTEIYEIEVNENTTQLKAGTGKQEDIETIIEQEVNPYGLVPANFFYDTRKPRKGHWCHPAEDLLSLQEIINLALTDTEFAIAFQKQKTLFITGDIVNDENNSGDQLIPAAQLGNTEAGAVYNDIPFYQTRKQSYIGGLGSIAKLGLDGGGSAGKAEFVGPDTDLEKLDNIINSLVEAVANDWCVNLNFGGGGKANSGFQLVVEEISNLQLRDMRAQTMQASLRKWYEITKQIYPGQLTDGYLQVEFASPNLPVNVMEQENIWTIKIDNNRASVKDYFMEERGMTEEEALLKIEEILDLNAQTNPAPPPVVAPPGAPKPSPNASATDGITNG